MRTPEVGCRVRVRGLQMQGVWKEAMVCKVDETKPKQLMFCVVSGLQEAMEPCLG